jgi:hypothetical protein
VRTINYLLVPLVGIIAFALLSYVGFSTGESFYLAFTFASTVGAIVALSEKERSILEATAFGTLLVVLAVVPHITGIAPSTLSIVTPTAQITIPTTMIPWICLGLVGFMAVAVTAGANAGAMGLWVLSVILVLIYYVVADPMVKLFSIVVVAIIASQPLLTATGVTGVGRFGLLGLMPALPSYSTQLTVDLSTANPYAVLLLPLLTFISLDPFGVVKRRVVKDLCAVLATFVVLLHVIDLFLST